ncbi:MAG TPA: glycosyltransferase family 4 protein [Burkholderiales bacterium]|nr:glycosyltransferase family 4 protein [Burkholderiales bacterium]
MSARPFVQQVNFQQGFGGGEVFTAMLTGALRRLGIDTRIFVDPRAGAWSALPLGEVRLEPLRGPEELPGILRGARPCPVLFHTLASADVVGELRAQGHLVLAFAHMPLYGRDPRPLLPFDLVVAGSRHVIASLRAAGIERIYPQPLYGVAQLDRTGADSERLRAGSRYDWDRHKVRDRLLGALEPLWQPFLPHPEFNRRPGLTLGVVSRITPIKQFPLLFSHIAPILARLPTVQLEIFGSGGYASVRDLLRALGPMKERARFWGHQKNVAAVYRSIDFLLTGLPEKEALGLNVIEAQACGTPVLAPDAPPFDETVMHEATGLRYRDPREDGGADFGRTLKLLLEGGFLFDADRARAHLAQFSEEAFVERVRALIEAIWGGRS